MQRWTNVSSKHASIILTRLGATIVAYPQVTAIFRIDVAGAARNKRVQLSV
jgi:hypothetical protein